MSRRARPGTTPLSVGYADDPNAYYREWHRVRRQDAVRALGSTCGECGQTHDDARIFSITSIEWGPLGRGDTHKAVRDILNGSPDKYYLLCGNCFAIYRQEARAAASAIKR